MSILIIILTVLIIAFIMFSLTRPKTYHLERSLVVNVPVNLIWEKVGCFKNWKKWFPWLEKGVTVRNTYQGVYGAVGAMSSSISNFA
ncbi:MAG: hypothetical protein ACI8ZX_000925 [Planctomycetota bacterium]|jgi:hypothetical protein